MKRIFTLITAVLLVCLMAFAVTSCGKAEVVIGENGNWFIDGVDSGIKAAGADAEKITIGENGTWFIGAEEVITDTFHGAVLSIVTNSTMFVKLKPTNRNKLLWLMQEYGLEDRVLDDFSELNIVSEKNIDFNKVNAVVREKREYSLNYLKGALSDD